MTTEKFMFIIAIIMLVILITISFMCIVAAIDTRILRKVPSNIQAKHYKRRKTLGIGIYIYFKHHKTIKLLRRL